MKVFPNSRKVRASRNDVTSFNRGWPCSTLRDTRSYWFEFDADGNLVDTDCPESDDGRAALADDCKVFLETGELPIYARAD